jgi:uncharacterized membrane protein YphA (DoxX/SURF4 family)
MLDLVQIILALLGFVLGIILIVAQLQLFAIRRLLETLVQQTRSQGAPAPPERAPLPPTPAEQKRSTIGRRGQWVLTIIVVALLIIFVVFVIVGVNSWPKQ